MNRYVTASQHFTTPKKNVPCSPLLAVVKFSLKKERAFFFGVPSYRSCPLIGSFDYKSPQWVLRKLQTFTSSPSGSRAGGGTMRMKFWQSYFLGWESVGHFRKTFWDGTPSKRCTASVRRGFCQNFGSFVFEFGCRKWKRRCLGRNFPFAPCLIKGEVIDIQIAVL